MDHRSRLSGEGFKPPKGALVKSQGIERLGKVQCHEYCMVGI
ncbi:MAG: hypothetical protein PF444_07675 [Bacteroidales bacterium]|nr:hypothetical protein [Bacteroidales bacterium]